MSGLRTRWLAAAALLAAMGGDAAVGQNPAGVSILPGSARPGSYQRVSGMSNPALDFYGGSRSMAYAPQAARVTQPPATQPVTTAPDAKPFSSLQQGSNLSPYLALDIRESSVGLPSYYAFVRPQMQQQQFAQQQQTQNRRTEQQLRSATVVGATTRGVNGGIPTTGHSTQFFNLGGYYPSGR
ncbi:MAG: hypothetical protein KDA44_15725 [Planctomycetales bacterium]|nr:hypothetical protein [Planctomycetales bacterium]